MEQFSWESYFLWHSNPYYGRVLDIEDASDLIREFSYSTSTSYTVTRSTKNFGNFSFGETNGEHLVRFEDDGRVQLGSQINSDGVPFMVVGSKLMECHQGPNHRKGSESKKTDAADHIYSQAANKKKVTGTKKKGCKAAIFLREIVFFPDYKPPNDTAYWREMKSSELRRDLHSDAYDEINYQNFIYIDLPQTTKHSEHIMGMDTFAQHPSTEASLPQPSPTNSSVIATSTETVSTSLPTTVSTPITRATPINRPTPVTVNQTDQWVATGTPSVTFNPRQNLVNQQDMDFAVSLAIDQDRENLRQEARVRRTLERTERQRQRDIQKEEAEKLQLEAIDQVADLYTAAKPEDIISVVFVLPDQEELNKKISVNTNTEILHVYIEALTDVAVAKLIYCGQQLCKGQTTLKNLDINGNCRIVVEDVLDESLGSEESETETEVQTTNLLNISDVTDLERRRMQVRDCLLPPVSLTINRDHIVEELIHSYTTQPDLVHHELNVTFVGEEAAVDLDGVTRDMFSCFFLAIMVKFFVGVNQKVPMVDPRTLFNGTFTAIGKIISHAFVLCNYLPPFISPIVYILIGCGTCSDDIILSSFLAYVPEIDKHFIEQILSPSADLTNLRPQLINFISTYGGLDIPTAHNLRQSFVELARLSLTVVPFVPISRLKIGMDCYPLLWQGVSETLVLRLMENFRPTHEKVIQLLSYTTSDDVTLLTLEERVKIYFERYIRTLSLDKLSALLRFWTSSDTLCLNKLDVSFNSSEGLNRRPIANTCSATLQISRFYFSMEDLANDFDLYLKDNSSRVFDSI